MSWRSDECRNSFDLIFWTLLFCPSVVPIPCRFIMTNSHSSTWSHLVRLHDSAAVVWFGNDSSALGKRQICLVGCLDILYERWGKINPELRREAGHLLHISVFWWHILYRQQDNHSTTAWAVDMGFVDPKWVLLLWLKHAQQLLFLNPVLYYKQFPVTGNGGVTAVTVCTCWVMLLWKEKLTNPLWTDV